MHNQQIQIWLCRHGGFRMLTDVRAVRFFKALAISMPTRAFRSLADGVPGAGVVGDPRWRTPAAAVRKATRRHYWWVNLACLANLGLVSAPAESGLNAVVGAFMPAICCSESGTAIFSRLLTPSTWLQFESGTIGTNGVRYVGHHQQDHCSCNPWIYRPDGYGMHAGLITHHRNYVSPRGLSHCVPGTLWVNAS
jgi:hypothetical protein